MAFNAEEFVRNIAKKKEKQIANDIEERRKQQELAPVNVTKQILSPTQTVELPENKKVSVLNALIQGNKNTNPLEALIKPTKVTNNDTNIAATTANSLKLFGQGMMKAEEGMFVDAPLGLASTTADISSRLISGATSLFDKEKAQQFKEQGQNISKGFADMASQDWTSNALDYYGWNKTLDNGKTVAQTLEDNSLVKESNLGGKVIEGIGGMAPTILMGTLIPGATEGLNPAQVQKIQNLVSYGSLGTRSYGNGFEEAIQNGGTVQEANAYGLLNAATEIGTEWMSGGIPGIKGSSGLDGAFGKYVLKEGIEDTSKSLSKAIIKGLYKTGMEGVEEMVSEMISPFIKQFTYQYDKDKGVKGNLKEAANNLSFTDIVQAGIIGALTGAVLDGGEIASDIKASTQVDNTIDTIAKENNIELTNEQKEKVKQELNTEDLSKVSNELENISNEEETLENKVENGVKSENIAPIQEQLENQATQDKIAPIKEQTDIASLKQQLEELTNRINELQNIAPVKTKKTLNPIEIGNLTQEDASMTPQLNNKKYASGDENSSFYNNVTRENEILSQGAREALANEEDLKYYKSVTNEESLDKAFNKLKENGASEVSRWLREDSKNATATDVAEGWILLKQYSDSGDYNSMVEVAKKMREMGTKAGQTIQAFSIMSRLTPEGMVKYAQSELSEAFDEMSKNKTKEWIDQNRSNFELTPEDVQFIMETMEKVSTMEDGYDKKVELAKIQKLMTDKLPPAKGQKIKSWMRLSMLFNPKTQVRNVVGNALIAPINYAGDVVSSFADKQIAKKTGVRTTGNINAKAVLKGLREGAYQATNDYKLGINTKNMEGNRFEMSEGKSFSDKNIIGRNLNRTEALLNYIMDAGDRVFSQASFENSLQNQMELNNVTEPTQEMIDIAEQEALSRTWNDNNNYTKFVLEVRSMLNKLNVNGYGLGDVLIPFAKTPANLTKAIVDYSPAGLIDTLIKGKNLKNNIENGTVTAKEQHQFVQSLGKATAGSMLYVLAYALAKAKIATGASDEDKDTANFIKNTLGVNSYSINIGGKSFTYDWAQPLAAPLSIMTDIVNSKDKDKALLEAVVSNLDSAGNTLLEQSFVQGISDVLSDNNGPVSGIINEILELPTRAIPTFAKQIADMVDGTQRQTYVSGSPIETAANKAKAKIPFVSKTLAPSVDTMGREIQKYGGKNNIFNVFLNPANVSNENVSEAAAEIYDVYKATGDKTIMPRVANSGLKLTPEQKAEFQKDAGQIIETSVQELMNNEDYQNLSYEDKASVIKNIVDYSYNKAKSDILDTEMSNTYNKINEYVEKGGKPSDYYMNKEEINYSLENPTKYKTITAITDYQDYKEYKKGIEDVKSKYENTNDRKAATISYVNSLDLTIPQKAMLIKEQYSSFKQYDKEIVSYVNSLDLTASEKVSILKELGFKTNGNKVSW